MHHWLKYRPYKVVKKDVLLRRTNIKKGSEELKVVRKGTLFWQLKCNVSTTTLLLATIDKTNTVSSSISQFYTISKGKKFSGSQTNKYFFKKNRHVKYILKCLINIWTFYRKGIITEIRLLFWPLFELDSFSNFFNSLIGKTIVLKVFFICYPFDLW